MDRARRNRAKFMKKPILRNHRIVSASVYYSDGSRKVLKKRPKPTSEQIRLFRLGKIVEHTQEIIELVNDLMNAKPLK